MRGQGLAPFLGFFREIVRGMERGPAAAGAVGFRRLVEKTIEGRLEAGGASVAEVARELGVSRQTLYRRLKAEGTTFEAVLDGHRRRLAIRIMRDGKLSVKEAAYRLGFADPASFSRAFKRWTGKSPREARRS